jgi:hypothetical protein
MTFKGFRKEAPLMVEAAAEAGDSPSTPIPPRGTAVTNPGAA